MGLLKAKVNGAWVDITGGNPIPVAGAAGEFLIKRSATDYDTMWTPMVYITGSNLYVNGGVVFPSTAAFAQINFQASTGAAGLLWSGYSAQLWMQDTTWLRLDKSLYLNTGTLATDGYLSIGAGGAGTDATWRSRIAHNLWCSAAVRLSAASDSNGNLRFDTANPYIYAPSYIIIPNGLYVSGGSTYLTGYLEARGGIQNDSTNPLYIYGGTAMVTDFYSSNKSAGAYNTQQIKINNSSNAEAGLTCWNQGYGSAPIMRNYGPFGERWDFLNSPNSAYVGLNASAFTVTSSLRIKRDIIELRDGELLAAMSHIRVRAFWPKIGPQVQRPTERFRTLNERWQAHGRKPLRLTGDHTEPHDHDCAIDNCNDPCPVAMNHRERYGLIAEDLWEHLPNTVSRGEDGLPEGYDVDQIAALAFGGVGALARLVAQLHQRVTELENA